MTYKQKVLSVDRLVRLPIEELATAEVPPYVVGDPLLKSRLYSLVSNSAGLELIRNNKLWPNPHNSIESISFAMLAERFVATEKRIDITEVFDVLNVASEPRVRMHLLAVLSKSPVPIIRKFLPDVVVWMETTRTVFLYEGLTRLIAHLAKSGAASEALELAAICIAFRKERNPSQTTFRDEGVRPRWDVYEFKTLVYDGIRVLAQVEPLATFKLCCAVLEGALQMLYDPEQEDAPWEDHSTFWRPAIEEHEQNHEYSHKELLVPLIRDTAEACAANAPNGYRVVAQELEKHRWSIFKRVLVHVTRTHSEVAGPEQIRRMLLSDEMFFARNVLHEWCLLLKEQFPNLDENDRLLILNRIRNGFDEKKAIQSHVEWQGRAPEPELVSLWRKHYERDKLSFISAHLPIEWRQHYEALVKEIGEAEHPDFSTWSGGGTIGENPPKSVDELLQMDFTSIVEFLRSFEPAPKPMLFEVEGLASALESAARRKPEKFDADLRVFDDLRPAFVGALIRGLTEAATERKNVPIRNLLAFLNFLSQSSSAEPSRPTHKGSGIQLEIARSLRKLMRHEPSPLTIEDRPILWQTLTALTDDHNPTAEDEASHYRNRKFATLSLNTTRGEAMHGLFDYANWLRRLLGTEQKNPAPEILDILTRRLALQIEPTLTIRAVYAEHLPWLKYFHSEWVAQHISAIFPHEPELSEYRRVAWDTFVTFCRPSVPLFDLLQVEYRRAVEAITPQLSNETNYDVQHPEEALSQHLLALYWWNRMSLSDRNSLIVSFFERASAKLRAHAIDYAGRAVKNSDSVPKEVIERLQNLCDWRLTIAQASDNKESFEEELASFESWVWSRKFDQRWTLSRLEQILQLTSKRDRFGHFVLEALAEWSGDFPLETVRCLEFFIRKDRDRVSWHAKPETIKTILMNAGSSSSELAKEIAARAEDEILRQGRFEFLTGVE
jgi:hypothetical protein